MPRIVPAFPPLFRRRLALVVAWMGLVSCAATPPGLAPEGASGWTPRPDTLHARHVVVAAHPLASRAGLQVLRDGGSAVDAAVAVQAVLGLVEPQSSGLGGGAFLLHHDGQRTQAYDGRETAPSAVDERLFLRPDGQAMPFREAVVGGRAVGVPGAVAMLALAHAQHGRLPWHRLLDPAIHLAEQGFPVSPRLARLLAGDPDLRRDPRAAALFYPGGQPLTVGARLRNPAYAEVLRRVAREGPAGLLTGPVAEDIVRSVQQHPAQPGALRLQDLAGYQARERPALCQALPPLGPGQRRFTVCGMPPPSSGGLAVGQILGMLARLPGVPAPAAGLDSGFVHLYTEAARLALADRALYVADPDFVPPPGQDWADLLAPAYLDQRAALLNARPGTVRMPRAPAGHVGPTARQAWAPMAEQPERGTSHLSIVDAWGHAVAMTTTVEDAFGARVMSDGGTGLPGGFLLNNQLTDFSFVPRDERGQPVANRVEAGKRPRSSMAPTLVFETNLGGQAGRLVGVAGSPGGAMIIHYTARTLWALMHGGLSAQQATEQANFGTLGGPIWLEADRVDASLAQALRSRGHAVETAELTSGLHLVWRTSGGWSSGVDPRREGLAAGD